MGLDFRPARVEDTEAAIPLVYSAGPEAFDYMLRADGKTALDFLRYAFADGRGFQGFRNHCVVERDGQVLGIGAFYSAQDELRLTLGMVQQIFAFYGWKAGLGVLQRALVVAPLMKPLRKDMLYVANLGVAEASRGQGVGAALLNFQRKRAGREGFKTYALDVAVTNPRAQKLYEGLGMKFKFEKKFRGDAGRSPVPDCRRLELQLVEREMT